MVLTPTLPCAFLWAWLVFGVLRAFAWLGDARRAVDLADPGALEVEGGVLRIEQEGRTTEIRCEDLRDERMEPAGDETYLLLPPPGQAPGGGAMRFDVAGVRRLLRAAKVGVDRRLLEVPLGSLAKAQGHGAVMHLLGPFLAGITVLTGVGMVASAVAHRNTSTLPPALLFLVGGLAVFAGLLHSITPGRAEVGTDGVRVVRLFGRRFVPYEKIREVKAWDNGVV